MTLTLTDRNRGHTPYGKFCRVHVRAYLPDPPLRRTKFICIVCDRVVDPEVEDWTAKEYQV